MPELAQICRYGAYMCFFSFLLSVAIEFHIFVYLLVCVTNFVERFNKLKMRSFYQIKTDLCFVCLSCV